MSTQSNAMPESFDSQKIAPAAMSATRPLYWSVRRELWENRSIYIAPLVAAIVFLLGFFISTVSLRHRMHGVWVRESETSSWTCPTGRLPQRIALELHLCR